MSKFTDIEGYKYEASGGIPSKVDMIFLYSLLNISQTNGWNDELRFSEYHILKFCGMNQTENRKKRLKKSLEKWKRVTISFSGTFYNNKDYSYIEFGVIDDWVLEKNDNKLEIRLNKRWLEKIRDSKYFKYVSFDHIKKLKSPLALRLYELVSKTFFKRISWEIDIFKLALKIPMTEKYMAHIVPKIQAATKRINEKTDLKIVVEVVKQGRGKGKFIFKRQSCKELKQLEQTSESSVKIPDIVFNLISKQYQKSCKKICKKIFIKDGEDALKYYISKANDKKKIANYGGYLKTLFDLDLYADFQEEQKKIIQAEKEKQEKIEKAFEKEMKKFAQRKTEQQERQDDQQRKKELIQNFSASDLETFDEYILQQNLNSFEKNRFNLDKKLILRLRFVDQFVTAKAANF